MDKAAALLWAKHLSYALLLSLRADYLYGRWVAGGCFVIFTGILWCLFSRADKQWTLKGNSYNERETVMLKSLLFSLLVFIYYAVLEGFAPDSLRSSTTAIIITVWCYVVFSRLYRGQWAIFRTKPHSDTYRVLRKCLTTQGSA